MIQRSLPFSCHLTKYHETSNIGEFRIWVQDHTYWVLSLVHEAEDTDKNKEILSPPDSGQLAHYLVWSTVMYGRYVPAHILMLMGTYRYMYILYIVVDTVDRDARILFRER